MSGARPRLASDSILKHSEMRLCSAHSGIERHGTRRLDAQVERTCLRSSVTGENAAATLELVVKDIIHHTWAASDKRGFSHGDRHTIWVCSGQSTCHTRYFPPSKVAKLPPLSFSLLERCSERGAVAYHFERLPCLLNLPPSRAAIFFDSTIELEALKLAVKFLDINALVESTLLQYGSVRRGPILLRVTKYVRHWTQKLCQVSKLVFMRERKRQVCGVCDILTRDNV